MPVVWSDGVREVVSSILDRGNSRMSFSSDQETGTVSSSEHAFSSKFWIYLEHCPRGDRPYAPFLYEVASHVKQQPFLPLVLLDRLITRATHVRNRVCPRVELILKIIIILLIIFLGFIKIKPC